MTASKSDPTLFDDGNDLTVAEQQYLQITDMFIKQRAYGEHLAAESKAADGSRQCCVCSTPDGLLAVDGWPGVYACRPCLAAL